MDYLRSFTIFQSLVVFVLGGGLTYALSRNSTSLPWRIFKLIAGLTTSFIVAGVVFIASPEERSQIFCDHAVSVQHVMLSEDDPFPYQRGLVAVPTAFPLPAVSGALIARADGGSRMSVTWDARTMVVTTRTLDGAPGAVLCGLPQYRGTPVRYEQATSVQPCPAP